MLRHWDWMSVLTCRNASLDPRPRDRRGWPHALDTVLALAGAVVLGGARSPDRHRRMGRR
jgi:hypothetical protein